jgi:hypothetical protein
MYLFALAMKIVSSCHLNWNIEVFKGLDQNAVVDRFVVIGGIVLVGSKETEATVSEILIDRSSSSFPPRQGDSLIPHELISALLPRVLVSTDDDGRTVSV